MAMCKDCVHVEVCCEKNLHVVVGMNIIPRFKYKRIEQECKNFKDRSRFVELLCEVGSTVFILDYDDGEPYDYSGYILLMTNKNHALLSPIVNGEKDPYELCEGYFENLEDDGSPYCGGCIIVPIHELMTREEAVQALKERES